MEEKKKRGEMKGVSDIKAFHRINKNSERFEFCMGGISVFSDSKKGP